MQLAKVKMIIQIQIIMLKEHIFLSQIDLEVIKFLLGRNSLNKFLILKMEVIFSNGNFNLGKIAQRL